MYLSSCSKLTDLNLSVNPISNDRNYANQVKDMLPQVTNIDD